MPEWRRLGRPTCPKCRDAGRESIVRFRLTDGVIEQFNCDECGYTDTPSEFIHE